MLAGFAAVQNLQRERGKCERLLVHAIAFREVGDLARLQVREPFTCADLAQECHGRRESARFSMQRSEGSIWCLGKVAVLQGAFECRALSEYGRLFRLEFFGVSPTVVPDREH